MKLDREFQKQWLEKLADSYPEMVNVECERISGDKTVINLWYLDDHGLIEALKSESLGAPPTIIAATITHKGLDFLADDGGLSAILGTVSIKLHADTLRDLLEAKIAAADLPEPEKKRFIDHVRSLPGEALKTVTTYLVEQALDHLPDAIPLLQKLLGF